jgi:hypothetical protein
MVKMEELKIKTYKLEELGKEARAKAIQEFGETQELELDFFGEDCKNQIEEAGFRDVEVRYSLGYSQGDGLCFEGKVDLKNFLKVHKITSKYRVLLNKEVSYSLKSKGHQYQHENMVYVESDTTLNELSPEQEKKAEELREFIEEARIELCRKLKKQGYDEIEYQQSEAAIVETVTINEYRFLENGSRRLYI